MTPNQCFPLQRGHNTSGMLISSFFSSTADPMLAEASFSTAHRSSHGPVPHIQHSGNYSSPDIHTHHHSAPSTIFTPGESLATDPYLISAPGPSTATQDEPVDEVMRPDKNDGPDSHSCSCLLVWNSVKDYWEWIYGWVVYSVTKLLIGMLLWKVWTQESFQKYVEFDRPGERSPE